MKQITINEKLYRSRSTDAKNVTLQTANYNRLINHALYMQTLKKLANKLNREFKGHPFRLKINPDTTIVIQSKGLSRQWEFEDKELNSLFHRRVEGMVCSLYQSALLLNKAEPPQQITSFKAAILTYLNNNTVILDPIKIDVKEQETAEHFFEAITSITPLSRRLENEPALSTPLLGTDRCKKIVKMINDFCQSKNVDYKQHICICASRIDQSFSRVIISTQALKKLIKHLNNAPPRVYDCSHGLYASATAEETIVDHNNKEIIDYGHVAYFGLGKLSDKNQIITDHTDGEFEKAGKKCVASASSREVHEFMRLGDYETFWAYRKSIPSADLKSNKCTVLINCHGGKHDIMLTSHHATPDYNVSLLTLIESLVHRYRNFSSIKIKMMQCYGLNHEKAGQYKDIILKAISTLKELKIPCSLSKFQIIGRDDVSFFGRRGQMERVGDNGCFRTCFQFSLKDNVATSSRGQSDSIADRDITLQLKSPNISQYDNTANNSNRFELTSQQRSRYQEYQTQTSLSTNDKNPSPRTTRKPTIHWVNKIFLTREELAQFGRVEPVVNAAESDTRSSPHTSPRQIQRPAELESSPVAVPDPFEVIETPRNSTAHNSPEQSARNSMLEIPCGSNLAAPPLPAVSETPRNSTQHTLQTTHTTPEQSPYASVPQTPTASNPSPLMPHDLKGFIEGDNTRGLDGYQSNSWRSKLFCCFYREHQACSRTTKILREFLSDRASNKDSKPLTLELLQKTLRDGGAYDYRVEALKTKWDSISELTNFLNQRGGWRHKNSGTNKLIIELVKYFRPDIKNDSGNNRSFRRDSKF